MLPAIVYLPLLGASYFIFDLFDTKVSEKKDANMQTTEYLNPNLPQAHIKGGDGIGGKYENMLNAYGKIEDHSAVENIDRDNEQEKEEYQSKYSDAELQQLDAEAKRQAEMEKQREAQEAHERQRENEALTELNKVLAEARLKGQQATQANISTSAATSPADSQDSAKGGLGYIKSIAPHGLPVPMIPIIWFFEFVSLVIRLLTLAVRLYGNMFAGHMVLGIFAILCQVFVLNATQIVTASFASALGMGVVALIWFLFLVAMYCLECLVAFLQAYVFSILSAVYIGLAEGEH